MRKIQAIGTIALVILLTVCCTIRQKGEAISYKPPVAIIYKTWADYSKNVPVTLSDDKTKITSYPAPQDLFFNGQLAYPTPLAKGYLLDNRGIGPNTAFLSMTYEQYSKLATAPSTDDLYKLIIDKDPITHIYNLGTRYRYKDIVTEINAIIEHHKLKEFKRVK